MKQSMIDLAHLAPEGFAPWRTLDLTFTLGAVEHQYRHKDGRVHVIRIDQASGDVVVNRTAAAPSAPGRQPDGRRRPSAVAVATSHKLSRGVPLALVEPAEQLLERFRPMVPDGFEPELGTDIEVGDSVGVVQLWYRHADGRRHFAGREPCQRIDFQE